MTTPFYFGLVTSRRAAHGQIFRKPLIPWESIAWADRRLDLGSPSLCLTRWSQPYRLDFSATSLANLWLWPSKGSQYG
jgi:hypothetical protein